MKYKYIYNWFLFGVMEKLVQPLPLAALRLIGKNCARLARLIFRKRSVRMALSLSSLGPDVTERQAMDCVKEAWEIQMVYNLESLYRPIRMRRLYDELFLIDGEDRLKKALERGKGVVMPIAHFGAHHHIMPALTLKGYKVNQMARRPPTEAVENFSGVKRFFYRIGFNAAENYIGRYANFIPVDGPMRPIFRALSQNEVLVLAVDGRVAGKTIPLSLLGQTYNFSSGAFDIAQRTGAAVLPAFILREGNGRHRVVIEEEMECKGSGNVVDECAKKFLGLLESHVKNHPGHYAMTLYLEKKRMEKGG